MSIIKNLLSNFKSMIKRDFPYAISFFLIGLASFLSLIAPFFSFQDISRLVGSTSLSIFNFSYTRGILIMIFSVLSLFAAKKRRIIPSALLALAILITYQTVSTYKSTASLTSIFNLFSIGGLLYEFLNMESTSPGIGAMLLSMSTTTYLIGFISYLPIRFLIKKRPPVREDLGLETVLLRIKSFYTFTMKSPVTQRLIIIGPLLIAISLFLPTAIGLGSFPTIYFALIRSLILLITNFLMVKTLGNKKYIYIGALLNLLIYLSILATIKGNGLYLGFGFLVHSLGLILIIASLYLTYKKK